MGHGNKAQQARECRRARSRTKQDLRNRHCQAIVSVLPMRFDGIQVNVYRPSGSAWLLWQWDGDRQMMGSAFAAVCHFLKGWPDVKKPNNGAKYDPDGNPALAPADKDYESLQEFLAHGKYEDGTKRLRSTISVSFSDGAFKACLRDKDMSRCLWVASGTLSDLLYALEMAVHADDAEWRHDRFSEGGPGHAGKKR